MINDCICNLKLCKTCDADDLTAEHLLLVLPPLNVHIKFLFGAISKHGFVPEGFGSDAIIRLLTDKAGNVNDIDNYRDITLVLVISKLFEGVILKICEDIFVTYQLQFGFKQKPDVLTPHSL